MVDRHGHRKGKSPLTKTVEHSKSFHRQNDKNIARRDPELDNLYICLYNPKDKRKNILGSIKEVLLVQEEHERVLVNRKEKLRLLNEIKGELDKINGTYQHLKTLFPNVKNVLSYTERELHELDEEVKMLRLSSEKNHENIELDENIEDYLYESSMGRRRRYASHKDSFEGETLSYSAPEKEGSSPATVSKDFSRLDRIKNNLRVIESKLNKV